MNPDPVDILTTLVIVICSIGFHEFAHAYFADMAGDPTPRAYGRITLNPFKHFDPTGLIFLVILCFTGYGIGYGFTPMQPNRMRNPRWDYFVAVAAGPICNLAQAVVYALLLRLFVHTAQSGELIFILLFKGCLININLFLFNLLPIGPLDGSRLIGQLLADKPRLAWNRFQASFGIALMIGFILMVQLGNAGEYIRRPAQIIFQWLTRMDSSFFN